MDVGLFIPCYIDQFYPQVGLATVNMLERFGVSVADLLEANDLTPEEADSLRVGQELIIP